MTKRFKYKVRLYYDFEMDDYGEPDRHYAKCEAVNKLQEELSSCYTPEEVFKELKEVLKSRVQVKKLKMEDID